MNTLNFYYQNTLYSLASSVTWRFNVFDFAFSADHSLNTAMHMPILARGGITGAIRRNDANSAASAELPAADESQFGGFSPAVCHALRRTIPPFPPSLHFGMS